VSTAFFDWVDVVVSAILVIICSPTVREREREREKTQHTHTHTYCKDSVRVVAWGGNVLS